MIMAATFTEGGTIFHFIPYLPRQNGGTSINFRAHITNITDSYSPQWNTFTDMGHGSPKVMYSQFGRTVSVDFMTVMLSNDEYDVWIEALNAVSNMTKPVYKSGLGYNGVFTKIKIGNFLSDIGYISNCTWQVDNETPWIKARPVVINCSITIEIIGEKKPEYTPLGALGAGLGNGRSSNGKSYGPSSTPPMV